MSGVRSSTHQADCGPSGGREKVYTVVLLGITRRDTILTVLLRNTPSRPLCMHWLETDISQGFLLFSPLNMRFADVDIISCSELSVWTCTQGYVDKTITMDLYRTTDTLLLRHTLQWWWWWWWWGWAHRPCILRCSLLYRSLSTGGLEVKELRPGL